MARTASWSSTGGSGRDERFIPVTPVEVEGTTVGCGDAFIAAFLASFWTDADITAAVEAGKVAGAEATAWRRPLPDAAYGEAAAEALRSSGREKPRKTSTTPAMAIAPPIRAWRRRSSIATEAPVLPSSRTPPRHDS